MVKEKKHGLMEQCTKVITLWVGNMDMGNLCGQMDRNTQDNFSITTSKGRVTIHGLMEGNIKEIGATIKWMVEEFSHGLMDVDMKESI
jgi:hypothetical protein